MIAAACAIASATPARADDVPPPSNLVAPDPYANLEPFRFALVTGVAGTRETDELAPAFGIEMLQHYRLGRLVSIGAHLGILMSNWGRVPATYRKLNDERRTIDECCAKAVAVYMSYAGAWAAGSNIFTLGPELVLGRREASSPWISFGSSLTLGFFDDDAGQLKFTWAHASRLAVGYDWSGVGLSLRAESSPPVRTFIFGSSGPSIFTVTASVEFKIDVKPKR